jgi:hypothetical protein
MTASVPRVGLRVGIFAALAVASLSVSSAVAAQARDPQYPYDGYSYLRIADAKGPLGSDMIMRKLNGTHEQHGIEIDGVYVHLTPSAAKSHAAGVKTTQKAIAVQLPAHSAGAGTISFAKSADDASDRVEAAVKSQEVFKDAELLLYNEETLVGRFVLKGVVFTNIEAISAAACPQNAVTLTFRAIERE